MGILKLKAKTFVMAVLLVIAADLMFGTPQQTKVSLVAPQDSAIIQNQ